MTRLFSTTNSWAALTVIRWLVPFAISVFNSSSDFFVFLYAVPTTCRGGLSVTPRTNQPHRWPLRFDPLLNAENKRPTRSKSMPPLASLNSTHSVSSRSTRSSEKIVSKLPSVTAAPHHRRSRMAGKSLRILPLHGGTLFLPAIFTTSWTI